MTHYNVSYKGLPREEADAKAIADIIDYIGQERYDLLVQTATDPTARDAAMSVNVAMGFCGNKRLPLPRILPEALPRVLPQVDGQRPRPGADR